MLSGLKNGADVVSWLLSPTQQFFSDGETNVLWKTFVSPLKMALKDFLQGRELQLEHKGLGSPKMSHKFLQWKLIRFHFTMLCAQAFCCHVKSEFCWASLFVIHYETLQAKQESVVTPGTKHLCSYCMVWTQNKYSLLSLSCFSHFLKITMYLTIKKAINLSCRLVDHNHHPLTSIRKCNLWRSLGGLESLSLFLWPFMSQEWKRSNNVLHIAGGDVKKCVTYVSADVITQRSCVQVYSREVGQWNRAQRGVSWGQMCYLSVCLYVTAFFLYLEVAYSACNCWF